MSYQARRKGQPMTQQPNFEALISFLDYLADKGLMKRHTVSSRKAVVNKIFGALDDADRQDVLAADVDTMIDRFVNLEGNNYTPESLQTYRSRLKSTLEDFAAYRSDPLSFRPSVQQRAARRTKSQTEANSTSDEKTPVEDGRIQETADIRSVNQPTSIFPIPLRADLTIKIQGLPFDLTESEANKLSAIIKAFAKQE